MGFDWSSLATGIVAGAVGAGWALRNAVAKEVFARKCATYSRILETANTFYFMAAAKGVDRANIVDARKKLLDAHHASMPFAHPDVVEITQRILWLPIDAPHKARDEGSPLLASLVDATRKDLRVKKVEIIIRSMPL